MTYRSAIPKVMAFVLVSFNFMVAVYQQVITDGKFELAALYLAPAVALLFLGAGGGVKVCLALAAAGSLDLLDECKLCRKFPPFLFVILGGGAATGLIVGGGSDEEQSPSSP